MGVFGGDALRVLRGYGQGALGIGRDVYNYAQTHTPQQVAADAQAYGKAAYDNFQAQATAHRNDPTWLTRQLIMGLDPRPAVRDAITAERQAAASNDPNAWKHAVLAGGMALGATFPGGDEASAALREGEEVTRNVGGMIGKRGRAEIDAAKAKYLPTSTKPVAQQAGEMGVPLGGPDQMLVAHPPASANKGSYHNVSPTVPPHEVSATYRGGPQLPQLKIVTPEDLEGKDVISFYGDRTLANGQLVGVNGHRFDTPVDLQGGPDYGRWQEAHGSPAVWASMPSAVGALNAKIRASLDAGREVRAVFTPMGTSALDQSTMMTDAASQWIKGGGILKKHLDAFDRVLRRDIPGIPSVRDPDAVADFLRNYPGDPTEAMGARTTFVKALDKEGPLSQGFPDIGALRMALTDPHLLDVPAGSTGYRVFGLGPETLDPVEGAVPHGSYSRPMAGTNLGQLNSFVPFNMMFPDWQAARRAAGDPIASDLRSFEFAKPIQTMTPEVVDRLMDYQERAGIGRAPMGDGILPPAPAPEPPPPQFTTWHGTPHAPFDAFSDDAIGSGEGAQAYGWGHYTAQEPDTGRFYRDGLTNGPEMTIGGRPIYDVYDELMRTADAAHPVEAQKIYDKVSILDDLMNDGDVAGVNERRSLGSYTGDSWKWFNNEVAPNFSRKGSLLQVGINADPEHYLDWDKPLTDQHPVVQQALAQHGIVPPQPPSLQAAKDKAVDLLNLWRGQNAPASWVAPTLDEVEKEVRAAPHVTDVWQSMGHMPNGLGIGDRPLWEPVADQTKQWMDELREMTRPQGDYPGRQAYWDLAERLNPGSVDDFTYTNAGEDQRASQALEAAGVPGIRYQDQGSRGSTGGTSNFVTFNPDRMQILNRYAVPGAIGAGALWGASQFGAPTPSQPAADGSL